MLIVLQGPMGSGKTTLAKSIKLVGGDVVLYDNVDVSRKAFITDIRDVAKTTDVIVTTTGKWPFPQDYVWHLGPIESNKRIVGV